MALVATVRRHQPPWPRCADTNLRGHGAPTPTSVATVRRHQPPWPSRRRPGSSGSQHGLHCQRQRPACRQALSQTVHSEQLRQVTSSSNTLRLALLNRLGLGGWVGGGAGGGGGRGGGGVTSACQKHGLRPVQLVPGADRHTWGVDRETETQRDRENWPHVRTMEAIPTG